MNQQQQNEELASRNLIYTSNLKYMSLFTVGTGVINQKALAKSKTHLFLCYGIKECQCVKVEPIWLQKTPCNHKITFDNIVPE